MSHAAAFIRPDREPLGFRKDGRPFWAILGASPDGDGDGDDHGGDNSGSDGSDDGDASGSGDDQNGFPANTPVAEMEPAQQTAYWKHQARKHQSRADARKDYDQIKTERDTLRSQGQTPADKALEDARAEARKTAIQELGERAVDIHVNALAAAGRMTEDAAEVILDGLDRKKYLTADGELDHAKLSKYLDIVAPRRDGEGGGTGRDPHQGRGRGGSTKPSGINAGREMFSGSKKK